MSEILHFPEPAGVVGQVDSWGYGSRTSVLRWPTLPGRPSHNRRSTTGGVVYPAIAGCREEPAGSYGFTWGGAVRYIHTDGRIFRPVRVDGREAILEEQGQSTEARAARLPRGGRR